MTRFNQCPNCERKPDTGFFASSFAILECQEKECGTVYCRECGDGRCPDCGSKKQKEVGRVHPK